MSDGKVFLLLLGVSVALHTGALFVLSGLDSPKIAPGETLMEVDFISPGPQQPLPGNAAAPKLNPVQLPDPPAEITRPDLMPDVSPLDPFSSRFGEPSDPSFMPKPPTLPQSTARESNPLVLMEYKDVLGAWLDRYKRYPRAAERQGIEGEPVLRIVVDRTGHVLSAIVEQPSGSLLLDRAALRLVERANPFPAFPDHVHESSLEYLIPITFSLD